jgi:hypothetical protein
VRDKLLRIVRKVPVNAGREAKLMQYDDNASDSHQKSIYDPCPAGWRLPLAGTWDGFSEANFTWSSTGRGYKTSKSSVFYMATGCRYGNNSGLNYIGSRGFYWSATPDSNINGLDLYFLDSEVNPQSLNTRSNAFPVRCSQE